MQSQLDRHSRADSPIHRLRAGIKFGAAMAVVGVAIVTPLAQWPVFAGLGALLIVVTALSRVPWRFLLWRFACLEPFVLGVALLTLLQPNGGERCATMIVRSSVCLGAMLLLACSTPFPSLLALLRWLRIPALLITTLSLMYRYLFVLADEAQRMHRARMSRSFSKRRWHGWRALATVIGQLFVRATARAERIHAAMQARGGR